MSEGMDEEATKDLGGHGLIIWRVGLHGEVERVPLDEVYAHPHRDYVMEKSKEASHE